LRKEAKSAFDLLYRSGLNVKQALEEAEKRSWAPQIFTFWEFVSASKRGICPMVQWRELKSDLAGE
jgi:acyl-[acyl carrier protein]--UDP-N-acetylglucosamine O-acyltransferase